MQQYGDWYTLAVDRWAFALRTFLDSFRNKSGKPEPIRTKVGTHAQVKGLQRSRNFRRHRLSAGEMGAKKHRC